MKRSIRIGERDIRPGGRTYIVAEMSANHGQEFETAVRIVEAAAKAGADAVKLQTYTPDTMTLDCDAEYFRIKGTIWEGRSLYELYGEAYTPWDWQPRLQQVASRLGMALFSTPFDETAVDFLEAMKVPCYKIASFEIVDIPLLRTIARTHKPVIMSTGMATLGEIEEAVKTLRKEGCDELALLKCVSAYPAPPEEMNLRSIPHLSDTFHVPVGLSDHSLNFAVPIAAVSMGVCIIEKHLTLSRSDAGADGSFSLEPKEFKEMVDAVRTTERALGTVQYGIAESETKSRVFRRSLFVVRDVAAGDRFTRENVRSIRPANGLHPRHMDDILGKRATRDLQTGIPLWWDMVDES